MLSDPALRPDAADAVRHLGGDLRAAAARARQHRRHPVRRGRHDRTRPRRRKIEKELGLDQPIVVQYVALDRRAGCTAISAIPTSRRSRRWTRSCRASRSPRSLPAWRSSFAVLFGVPLGVISAVRQNTRARLRAARGQPQRAVDAVVLARAADPDGVRALFRLRSRSTPTRRRRFWDDAPAVQRAGGGGRLPHLGADHAADALVDAGGAAAGLHPHRARQGRVRAKSVNFIMRCATPCCRSSPSSASRRRS